MELKMTPLTKTANERAIAIASEHAGFDLKEFLIDALGEIGYNVHDLGISKGELLDYPRVAYNLCNLLIDGQYSRGILICGTGIGMSIAANKIRGVRAALCTDIFSASMARLHNDANVLCLGSRITAQYLSLEIVKTFLKTTFEGGRHIQRVENITFLESI